MGARFGAFHRTKYIKSYDNMAQIRMQLILEKEEKSKLV